MSRQHIKALNKVVKARKEIRKTELIKLVSEGTPVKDAAQVLGVSTRTVYGDLKHLTHELELKNPQAFSKLRTMQVGALLDMAEQVKNGEVPPDVANSWTAIMNAVTRLLGLNAPKRSVNYNFDINYPVEMLTDEEICLRLLPTLNDEDWTRVRTYAESLVAQRRARTLEPPVIEGVVEEDDDDEPAEV